MFQDNSRFYSTCSSVTSLPGFRFDFHFCHVYSKLFILTRFLFLRSSWIENKNQNHNNINKKKNAVRIPTLDTLTRSLSLEPSGRYAGTGDDNAGAFVLEPQSALVGCETGLDGAVNSQISKHIVFTREKLNS